MDTPQKRKNKSAAMYFIDNNEDNMCFVDKSYEDIGLAHNALKRNVDCSESGQRTGSTSTDKNSSLYEEHISDGRYGVGIADIVKTRKRACKSINFENNQCIRRSNRRHSADDNESPGKDVSLNEAKKSDDGVESISTPDGEKADDRLDAHLDTKVDDINVHDDKGPCIQPGTIGIQLTLSNTNKDLIDGSTAIKKEKGIRRSNNARKTIKGLERNTRFPSQQTVSSEKANLVSSQFISSDVKMSIDREGNVSFKYLHDGNVSNIGRKIPRGTGARKTIKGLDRPVNSQSPLISKIQNEFNSNISLAQGPKLTQTKNAVDVKPSTVTSLSDDEDKFAIISKSIRNGNSVHILNKNISHESQISSVSPPFDGSILKGVLQKGTKYYSILKPLKTSEGLDECADFPSKTTFHVQNDCNSSKIAIPQMRKTGTQVKTASINEKASTASSFAYKQGTETAIALIKALTESIPPAGAVSETSEGKTNQTVSEVASLKDKITSNIDNSTPQNEPNSSAIFQQFKTNRETVRQLPKNVSKARKSFTALKASSNASHLLTTRDGGHCNPSKIVIPPKSTEARTSGSGAELMTSVLCEKPQLQISIDHTSEKTLQKKKKNNSCTKAKNGLTNAKKQDNNTDKSVPVSKNCSSNVAMVDHSFETVLALSDFELASKNKRQHAPNQALGKKVLGNKRKKKAKGDDESNIKTNSININSCSFIQKNENDCSSATSNEAHDSPQISSPCIERTECDTTVNKIDTKKPKRIGKGMVSSASSIFQKQLKESADAQLSDNTMVSDKINVIGSRTPTTHESENMSPTRAESKSGLNTTTLGHRDSNTYAVAQEFTISQGKASISTENKDTASPKAGTMHSSENKELKNQQTRVDGDRKCASSSASVNAQINIVIDDECRVIHENFQTPTVKQEPILIDLTDEESQESVVSAISTPIPLNISSHYSRSNVKSRFTRTLNKSARPLDVVSNSAHKFNVSSTSSNLHPSSQKADHVHKPLQCDQVSSQGLKATIDCENESNLFSNLNEWSAKQDTLKFSESVSKEKESLPSISTDMLVNILKTATAACFVFPNRDEHSKSFPEDSVGSDGFRNKKKQPVECFPKDLRMQAKHSDFKVEKTKHTDSEVKEGECLDLKESKLLQCAKQCVMNLQNPFCPSKNRIMGDGTTIQNHDPSFVKREVESPELTTMNADHCKYTSSKNSASDTLRNTQASDKTWDITTLNSAAVAVEGCTMGFFQAAEVFGIPTPILRKHLRDRNNLPELRDLKIKQEFPAVESHSKHKHRSRSKERRRRRKRKCHSKTLSTSSENQSSERQTSETSKKHSKSKRRKHRHRLSSHRRRHRTSISRVEQSNDFPSKTLHASNVSSGLSDISDGSESWTSFCSGSPGRQMSPIRSTKPQSLSCSLSKSSNSRSQSLSKSIDKPVDSDSKVPDISKISVKEKDKISILRQSPSKDQEDRKPCRFELISNSCPTSTKRSRKLSVSPCSDRRGDAVSRSRSRDRRSDKLSNSQSREPRIRDLSRSRNWQSHRRSRSRSSGRANYSRLNVLGREPKIHRLFRFRTRQRSRSRSREWRSRSQSREWRSRSRSRERRSHSRSKERKSHSRSREWRSHSRSRERRSHSRSRERRSHSRSRERRSHSLSRERRSCSRSIERRRRSQSREWRNRSRSIERRKSELTCYRSRSSSLVNKIKNVESNLSNNSPSENIELHSESSSNSKNLQNSKSDRYADKKRHRSSKSSSVELKNPKSASSHSKERKSPKLFHSRSKSPSSVSKPGNEECRNLSSNALHESKASSGLSDVSEGSESWTSVCAESPERPLSRSASQSIEPQSLSHSSSKSSNSRSRSLSKRTTTTDGHPWCRVAHGQEKVISIDKIPRSYTTQELVRRFGFFGFIEDARILRRPYCYQKNCAYVTYKNIEDAANAVAHGNDPPFKPPFSIQFGHFEAYPNETYVDLDKTDETALSEQSCGNTVSKESEFDIALNEALQRAGLPPRESKKQEDTQSFPNPSVP